MAGRCFGAKMWLRICLGLALVVCSLAQGQHSSNSHPTIGCMWKADLVFLLDGSITSSFVNFEMAKNITIDIIQRLAVNPTDGFVIGAIMFDTGVIQTINLDPAMETKTGLIDQVRSLPFSSVASSVNTHLAITSLQTMLLYNGRDMVGKIAVLITDSRMTDPSQVANLADEARMSNIRFIALGIGPLPTFMELFAVTNNNRYILQVVGRPPPHQIHRIVDTLIDRICIFDNPCIGGGEAVIEDMMKLPHPRDCAKYISCALDPGAGPAGTPIFRADTCRFGQFWDSAAAACTPVAQATCPYDPCMQTSLKSYAIKGLCNAFWVCTANKTNGFACCPQAYRFDASTHSCISDARCMSTCPSNPLWVVTIERPTTATTPPPTAAPHNTTTLNPPSVPQFGTANTTHAALPPQTTVAPRRSTPGPAVPHNLVQPAVPVSRSFQAPAVVAIRRPTTTPAPTTPAPTTAAPVAAPTPNYGSYYKSHARARQKPAYRQPTNRRYHPPPRGSYSQGNRRMYDRGYYDRRSNNYRRYDNYNSRYQSRQYYYPSRNQAPASWDKYPLDSSRTPPTVNVNVSRAPGPETTHLNLSVRANPLHEQPVSDPTVPEIQRVTPQPPTSVVKAPRNLAKTRKSLSVPKLVKAPQKSQSTATPKNQRRQYWRPRSNQRHYDRGYNNEYNYRGNNYQHNYNNYTPRRYDYNSVNRDHYRSQGSSRSRPRQSDGSFVITDTLVTINDKKSRMSSRARDRTSRKDQGSAARYDQPYPPQSGSQSNQPPYDRAYDRGPPPLEASQYDRGPPPGPSYYDRGPPPGPSQYDRGPAPGPSQYDRGPPPGPSQYDRGPAPGPSQYDRGPPPGPSQYDRGPPPGPSQYDRGPPPGPSQYDRGPPPGPSQYDRGPPPGPSQYDRGPPSHYDRGPPPLREQLPYDRGPPQNGPSQYEMGPYDRGSPQDPPFYDRGPPYDGGPPPDPYYQNSQPQSPPAHGTGSPAQTPQRVKRSQHFLSKQPPYKPQELPWFLTSENKFRFTSLDPLVLPMLGTEQMRLDKTNALSIAETTVSNTSLTIAIQILNNIEPPENPDKSSMKTTTATHRVVTSRDTSLISRLRSSNSIPTNDDKTSSLDLQKGDLLQKNTSHYVVASDSKRFDCVIITILILVLGGLLLRI